MKLKKANLLFLFALVVSMPLIAIEVSSATYLVDIEQTPEIVNADVVVTITVDVIDPDYGEEFNHNTYLNYQLNGELYTGIKPDQPIPSQEIVTLTFKIGPFDKRDYVEYKIYLDFIYAESYQSEWFGFGVDIRFPREPLTQTQIIYIAAGVVASVALLAMVMVTLRRRRK